MTYLVDSPSQTVDDIVSNIVASCRLPLSQITFTPQNIIGFLQDEQQTTLTNLIKKVREDYWLTNYDQPIVVGVYSYSMPPRCAAGALRDFVFVDASGFEIHCPHLDPDQIKTPSYFSFRPSWQGQGAFLMNDKVVLWPQTFNNVSYQLRQKYERRPNSLASSANCMQITGVNVGSNQITFAGAPPFVAAQLIDIISINGQFTSQGDNFLISTVVGSTVTMDSTTPITSTVTIGSWACPAGLTCIPQIPAEAYPLLLARGMLRIAAALQSSNLFSVASKMAEDAASKIMEMVTPRVSGNPRKFVNKNVVGGPYSFPYYR
jgi:hypothetical protein